MSKEDNLTPFKQGEDRARKAGLKGGKNKKGSKHLSTLIREIGYNIEWDKTNQKDKAALKERYGNNGWKAIVYVAFTQAISGNPQAMKWLAENGFGKNIDITSGGEKLNVALVEFIGDDDDKQN